MFLSLLTLKAAEILRRPDDEHFHFGCTHFTLFSKLNHDQRVCFEHMMRPGSDYELIQRRDPLRRELQGNGLGSNRFRRQVTIDWQTKAPPRSSQTTIVTFTVNNCHI